MIPHPKPISLDKARLDKLLARQQAAKDALAGIEAELFDYRVAYSKAHGFLVVLSLEKLLLSVAS